VLLARLPRVKELAYGEMITERLRTTELIGEYIRNSCLLPDVTRDPFRNRGRIHRPHQLRQLLTDIGLRRLIPPMTASDLRSRRW